MSLMEANCYPEAAVMIHNGKKINDERKAELKAIYLEGLIRFLDIYSQTEIGDGIEIDITKAALFVNNSDFENDDLYSFSCIEDVYYLLENLTLSGLPIWRFLRLSDYQSRILESEYTKQLIELKLKAANKKNCYGCIWLKTINTFLGVLRRCERPRTNDWSGRNDDFDADKLNGCKWITTMTLVPEKELNKLHDFRKREFLNAIPNARKKFEEKLKEDNFRIPKELSEQEMIEIDKKYDPWEDFGCAWRNKRTKSERQYEVRKAMFIEGMIRFFETYANIEMGTDYVADIKNIALWADNIEEKEVIDEITNFDEVYDILENMILNEADFNNFVKRKDF